MTDTVRVPRTTVVRLLAVVPKGSGLAVHLAAMLAASPQGEGDCVCVQRGDGPEGCGLCNETGVVTEGVKPQPDALPGDLREKIAGIIVRKVLQEDYDDLVEGYLDEILMAADEIILLPAYRAVAEAYYSRLSLIQSERGGG